MPWHVAQSAECSASEPWAVIADDDGSVVACHETEESAQAQMAALYANVPDASSQPGHDVRSGPVDELRFAVAPITDVDVRDSSDAQGHWTMSGYASVFSQKTTLYDGKFLKVTEEVHPEFFDRVLREQPLTEPEGVVHFNRGHDMNTSVAATDVPKGQPGSLQLKADEKGLFFLAKVPHDDPDGVALAAKMRSGVIKQASFAFSINKRETIVIEDDDGDMDEREVEHDILLDCRHLYDVCATPQGAYAQTVAGLRSLAASLGQLPDGRDLIRQTASTGTGGFEYSTTLSGAVVGSSVSLGDGVTVHPPVDSPARLKLAASIERNRQTAANRFKSRKMN